MGSSQSECVKHKSPDREDSPDATCEQSERMHNIYVVQM